MSLDKFDDLKLRVAAIRTGSGTTRADIAQAQDKLRINFPADYIRFLTDYGWAKIKHDYIFGLGPGVPDFANVVTNTLDERSLFEPFMPHYLVPIMNDGAGNHYCLDSSQYSGGESPVVFWDHESGDGQYQIPDIISPSFEAWLFDKAKSSVE